MYSTTGRRASVYGRLLRLIVVKNQKAYLWRPKPGDPIVANRHTELELPDTQRAEMFKVRVLEALRALDVNLANIESLRRGVAIFRRKSPDYISKDELREYDEALEDLCVLMSQHKLRMKNLLKRAEGLFALIITIIPYLFGRAEQTLMVRLSEKAAQYGKSMKVITVLCMLYLPPSVLSVCPSLAPVCTPAPRRLTLIRTRASSV